MFSLQCKITMFIMDTPLINMETLYGLDSVCYGGKKNAQKISYGKGTVKLNTMHLL